MNQPAKSGDVEALYTAGATTTSPINSRHYPSRVRVGDRVGDRVGVGLRLGLGLEVGLRLALPHARTSRHS